MDDPDYEALRRLVLRYGAEWVIKTVQQIAVHEPKQPELASVIAAVEKRLCQTPQYDRFWSRSSPDRK